MYGQAECIKIMERLNSSKLFMDKLQVGVNRHHVADAKTINNIIHSSHYTFILAPKRKIYFASLFFLQSLYKNFENLGIDIDEYQFMGVLLKICEPFEKNIPSVGNIDEPEIDNSVKIQTSNGPYYELIDDSYPVKEMRDIIATKIPPLKNFSPMNGIVESKGVDDILLNEIVANHVFEKYGDAYDLYNVNGKSIEMRYFKSDFSCFFHEKDLDMKIIAVRLWKNHEAFKAHNKSVCLYKYIDEIMTLMDVFSYHGSDAEYVKCYDDSYYVDFGFFRYHFLPEYEGQYESSITIDSITLVYCRDSFSVCDLF